MKGLGTFPSYRARRLRKNPSVRILIQESSMEVGKLVAPLFIKIGSRKEGISSMPGISRLPVAQAVEEARELWKLGIRAVLLFGIPAKKDLQGSGAAAANGVVQQAIKGIKKALPEMVVITDVCLCEYTVHGHCGILNDRKEVDNDASIEALAQVALSHAQAGADWVAPSAMMDGQVRAIRQALDQEGFSEVAILSYSAKYASALYGPFREAAESTPQFGDRRSYQMDPANVEEALREVALDIEEGADVVMVKPALLVLDVLAAVKKRFHWPTAAYQVSGEYALIKAAAAKGWVDEKRLVLESMIGMKRAGADLVITYYAKELGQWLKKRSDSHER